MEDLKWMDSANCTGVDTNYFFPVDDTKQYHSKELLTRICNNCEVKDKCQEYSLRYAVLGWWANTTERQRRDRRQKLNIKPIQIFSEGVYQ